MSLAPGVRLGPYEILSPLGIGGMGEVYRARDTKLNREVAIKVLPELLAHDPDRLARFQREAHVLAALNHPNIAHIHGFEESPSALRDPQGRPELGRGAAGSGQGAVRALVMELVEGQDLSERIAHGAIPVDEALPIAKQIAEALEAAHEQGIIHRDLKPANIKVKADGIVKVLDFGLAKALDPIGVSSADAAMSPTLSIHATQAGVILGTAAYMSPEQARGKPVHKRADIWAFGVVLYEMLTGKRAFDAEDVSATLASVITKDPDWTALPATTPAAIRRLLRRCLEKDPKRRVPDIAVARLEIDDALAAPAGEASAVSVVHAEPRARWRRVIPFAAVILTAVAAALATWVVTRLAPPPSTPLTRFAIALPAGQGLAISFNARDLALSPDGTHLVYSAGNPTKLFDGRSILFDGRTAGGSATRMYDVSRDGQRFLVIKEKVAGDENGTPASIVVVQNWFEELQAKVPARW